MDRHKYVEDDEVANVLQLAYILEWRSSTARSVEDESFRRLMSLLGKLSEITYCPFVKKLCLEAVTSLSMGSLYGPPVKRTIFRDLAAHYGYPKLFPAGENKDE